MLADVTVKLSEDDREGLPMLAGGLGADVSKTVRAAICNVLDRVGRTRAILYPFRN